MPSFTDTALSHHSLLSSSLSSSKASPTQLDGHSLRIADIVSVARYGSDASLSPAGEVRDKVDASLAVLEGKIAAQLSVYGVSTGYGTSSDPIYDLYYPR